MHRLAYDYIMQPLLRKGILNLRYIRWTEEPREQDPNVDPFDQGTSQFKLVALILAGHKQRNHCTWSDVVKWYSDDMKWKGVFA